MTQRGFSLFEMTIATVLLGILAVGLVYMLRYPVEGYVISAQRAELTDAADIALRRLKRELQGALPNSIRVSVVGTTTYLEFLSTAGGGQYRAECAGAVSVCNSIGNDNLDILSTTDLSFDILGPPLSLSQYTHSIVINNLGVSGADAYEDSPAVSMIRKTYVGPTLPAASYVVMTNHPIPAPAQQQFTSGSPSNRFFVIDGPVTFVCDPRTGGTNGTLRRYWGYPIQTIQPTPAAPIPPPAIPISAAPFGPPTLNGLLIGNVAACNISYNPGLSQRNGIVTIQLTLRTTQEYVDLYYEIHVNNAS